MLAHILEEQKDMPYHTQKRFMFLPVMLPKLFNADFNTLSKLFNRMRDHSPFLKLFYALKHKRRKPFLEREATGQEVLKQYRDEHADQPLSEHTPSSTESENEPQSSQLDREFVEDVTTQDILEGAVWLLEAGVHELTQADSAEQSPPQQKIQEALELLRQAKASL